MSDLLKKEERVESKALKRLLSLEKAKDRGFWLGYRLEEEVVCPYVSSEKVRMFWVGVGLGRSVRESEGVGGDVLGVVLGDEEYASGVRSMGVVEDGMGEVEFELCELGEGDLLCGRGSVQVVRRVVGGGKKLDSRVSSRGGGRLRVIGLEDRGDVVGGSRLRSKRRLVVNRG